MLLLWLCCAGVSTLQLSEYESPWCAETYVAVFLPVLVIVAIGLVTMNFRFSSRSMATSQSSRRPYLFFQIVFFICAICAIYEWSLNGFDTIFSSLGESFDLKSGGVVGPLPIHLGVTLLPYCVLVFFYDLFFGKPSNRIKALEIIEIIACVSYIFFVQMSRGTLFVIALGLILYLTHKFEFKPRHLFLLGALVLVGALAMFMFRVNENSIVYNYTPYAPQFNALYSYVSANFNNLNNVILHGSNWSIVAEFFTFLDLSSGFYSDKFLMTANGVLNASTWLVPMYLDLGLLGILIYCFFIIAFVAFVYQKSILNPSYLVLLAFLQKPIWMIVFGNYFAINSYYWTPVILGFVFVVLSRDKSKSDNDRVFSEIK